MSEANYADLKKEAEDLGIEFKGNIGAAKLQAKIDAHYEALEVGTPKPTTEEVPVSKTSTKGGWTESDRRKLAAKRQAEANATHVITIIDNDQRVNNQTTSATVNCSNAMFDLGTVVLPLNTPVEVKQGHIDSLRSIKIPLHVKGRDGLSTVEIRNRYSISYEDKK